MADPRLAPLAVADPAVAEAIRWEEERLDGTEVGTLGLEGKEAMTSTPTSAMGE
jgi:hypothetical protein